MNKSTFRYAVRKTEAALDRLTKAVNAINERYPDAPLVRASELLKDWMDEAIVHRDNPANWKDGE